MTFAQYLRQQGEEKGWQRGREEGREEGEKGKALAIAQNMLAAGFEPAMIQKFTGLSNQEIAALISEHQGTSYFFKVAKHVNC